MTPSATSTFASISYPSPPPSLTHSGTPSHLSSSTSPLPEPLHLPRILALHGGGTNPRIFRAQLRSLSSRLSSHFRLVYVPAPYSSSQAGPDVVSVYKEWGPFRRWLAAPLGSEGPRQEAPGTESEGEMIARSIIKTIDEDDGHGGRGEWVGVLGFSQGAKVAGSLLVAEQRRRMFGLRFGVLIAGRGPFVGIDEITPQSPVAGSIYWDFVSGEAGNAQQEVIREKLRLPTVHVHGFQDPGLELHQRMLRQCCEEKSARVVEWDGGHRLPIKTRDVEMVVEAILEIAREAGVLKGEQWIYSRCLADRKILLDEVLTFRSIREFRDGRSQLV